jgi:hypothetical protein
VALWTCRCAWTTQGVAHMPTAEQQQTKKALTPRFKVDPAASPMPETKQPERLAPPGDIKSEGWARSSRNPGRDQIGTPGRDHRNPQPSIISTLGKITIRVAIEAMPGTITTKPRTATEVRMIVFLIGPELPCAMSPPMSALGAKLNIRADGASRPTFSQTRARLPGRLSNRKNHGCRTTNGLCRRKPHI